MSIHDLRLVAADSVSKDLHLLRFERPSDFNFEPGQYIRFHHEAVVRDYTLINPPAADLLEICVRHRPEGRFTPTLIGAPLGRSFTVEGPLGYFRFQSAPEMAVFVATGTGIAPFLAFARAGVRGFCLLHGAASEDALPFEAELRAAAGRYHSCLGQAGTVLDGAAPSRQERGRVTDLLRLLAPGAYHFYLCGNRVMIRDAIRIIDERYEGSPVFTETFY